ncbi:MULTISPECIES: hypothetical protein [unclassified Pseudomonas]|uniref:hypothetical protein n=1 Tax=unclassified Pseudomonas TaxID=196821 RepID=UPI002AC9A005|nr:MULTISPECIES: hypothetical protein [unclassified Pseudomonas]MEB0044215.1 hypothetical protein [Pseudomonas sp. Dout3]MEB0094848.1 hypothetical protein [Pseudomonas sp. DC1.2]WPX59791.1 hypothetical protein RHM68_03860 [Pseudomonas sp. DC1.2]
MRIFQRIVLLIKVMVMLSLGTSAAWANGHPVQSPGLWASNAVQGSALVIAKSDSEPGDEDQGGSKGDDDSTTKEPDTDDDEDGDSQS